MKITTFALGSVLIACSAVALAQEPTGGNALGNGSGMTRTQANSVTMNNPNAMGNASGQADAQDVGNMSSSNDGTSAASTDTALPDHGYPAAAPASSYPPSRTDSNVAPQSDTAAMPAWRQ